MVFPADKETWEDVETDDLIVKEHPNGIWDFLERLQDTLGINFLGGFGSLKLRLDDLKNILTTKKVKAIDTAGLKLKNTSEQGIEINNAGLVKVEKTFEVVEESTFNAGVTLMSSINLFGNFLGAIQLNEWGQIGQTKKTGISGAGVKVDHIAQADSNGCIWHYFAKDGTNFRTGTIQAVWDGTNVQYVETKTGDIGDTSPLTLAVVDTGTDIELQASAASGTWEVKVIHLMI